MWPSSWGLGWTSSILPVPAVAMLPIALYMSMEFPEAATELVGTPAKPGLSPTQTGEALVISQTLHFKPET